MYPIFQDSHFKSMMQISLKNMIRYLPIFQNCTFFASKIFFHRDERTLAQLILCTLSDLDSFHRTFVKNSNSETELLSSHSGFHPTEFCLAVTTEIISSTSSPSHSKPQLPTIDMISNSLSAFSPISTKPCYLYFLIFQTSYQLLTVST